jgi:hypothetical protein
MIRRMNASFARASDETAARAVTLTHLDSAGARFYSRAMSTMAGATRTASIRARRAEG